MKTKLLNATIFIISAIAVLELAMSQVHIKTITKLFTSEVGFYLFLFIISGLVTLFNLTSIKKSKNELMLLLSSIIAVAVGIKYILILLNDYKLHDSIAFSDVNNSIYLALVGILIYGIGSIAVIILKKSLKTK